MSADSANKLRAEASYRIDPALAGERPSLSNVLPACARFSKRRACIDFGVKVHSYRTPTKPAAFAWGVGTGASVGVAEGLLGEVGVRLGEGAVLEGEAALVVAGVSGIGAWLQPTTVSVSAKSTTVLISRPYDWEG